MPNLSIAILALTLRLVSCTSDKQSSPESVPELSTHHQPPIPFQGLTQANQPIHGERTMFKRSPAYDFGLGKRAYSYVSEYKRLPVYDFGLGKRARTYSFGLGKRSVDSNPGPDYEDEEDFKANSLDQNDVFEDWLDQYDDGSYNSLQAKRGRPYSFGLGKRYYEETENAAEKRHPRLYEFGLGKRAQLYNFGLGKRFPRTYSFGLGKRFPRTYAFGLGKRQRLGNRFNFGLGKRSVDNIRDDSGDIQEDSAQGFDTENY